MVGHMSLTSRVERMVAETEEVGLPDSPRELLESLNCLLRTARSSHVILTYYLRRHHADVSRTTLELHWRQAEPLRYADRIVWRIQKAVLRGRRPADNYRLALQSFRRALLTRRSRIGERH